MCSAWLVAIVALLAADAGTGTRLHRDAPLFCYSCDRAACGVGEVRTEGCPRDRPLCATVAVAPDFLTTLTCANATEEACSILTINDTSRVTCVCTSNLCNRPFSQEFIQHLNTTTLVLANASEAVFGNFTDIYSNTTEVTVNPDIVFKFNSPVTTTEKPVTDPNGPRVEPLKGSVPSEDDEDESEGSGTWTEEPKKRPASDPADPSSHLPAEGNRATNVILDVSVVTSIVLYSL